MGLRKSLHIGEEMGPERRREDVKKMFRNTKKKD
jgi:hypothetical protein